MNSIYLLFPVFTLFGALGSYFFKTGAPKQLKIQNLIFNHNIYIGGICYLVSAIINIKLLQELPYIIVLPCSALTYVWTFLISYIAIREKIGLMKILGICFILMGATCIAIG
jgi:drug/metabolite transporter (DMT)-like permease